MDVSSEIVVINNDDAESWDSYLDNAQGASFYHRYAWRGFFSEYFSKQTQYLAAKSDNAEITGVLPLVRQKSRLFGDYLVSVPFLNYGGAIADNPDTAIQLMQAAGDLAKDLGASHAEFRGTRDLAGFPVRTDKIAMVLDLPSSEEELSKALGAKRRSQIKRPLRENPVVRCGGIELLDGFYNVFARNMRDLGTPVYSKSMFAEILTRFKDNAHIVYIEVHGKPAAAAFLLEYNGYMEIPWASTVSDFNKISINMLLYWEVLKWAIKIEASQFDFGRSTVDSGTYRFKKQWGAKPRQLYWHYWLSDGQAMPKLNPDNAKYRTAIRLWQKLPLPIANFVGPHLVKHLP